jgi:hypothetical protein
MCAACVRVCVRTVTVLVEPAAAEYDVRGTRVLARHAGAVDQVIPRGTQAPAAPALARARRAVAELPAVRRLSLERHCQPQQNF